MIDISSNDEALHEYSLSDELDSKIFMHRDAHFGGNFPFMIDYYEKMGKGVLPELDLKRMCALHEVEQTYGKNLAGDFLSDVEVERVEQAKKSYETLKALYVGVRTSFNHIPRLIADLILSEENDPIQEIDAIVAEKNKIVPALLDLVKSENYHDPLFPGYGIAPSLAAKCLGLIGDKRAIISLFELIGNEDFFNEEDVLKALYQIGEPAKEFLLKILQSKPFTFDNERAAIVLLAFKEDQEVAEMSFSILKQLDLKKFPILATYLILICEGLKSEKSRQELLSLEKDPNISKSVKLDIKTISKSW